MIAFPPDVTFLIQIVSFFVLWFGLKRLLFDPVLDILERRRARTVGVREEAAALRSAVDSSAASYDERMNEARVDIARAAETARNATDAEEDSVLTTARDRAGAHLREQREQIRVEAERARATLAGEAGQLAELIVKKVVGERA